MAQLNPYLNFPGTTEEAFEFYKSVFGGEIQAMMRFSDMPEMEQSPEQANKIMHAAFPIGENMLMATDVVGEDVDSLVEGNNFMLSITPDSKEEADRLFAALSEGGEVEVPMKMEVWGGLLRNVERPIWCKVDDQLRSNCRIKPRSSLVLD